MPKKPSDELDLVGTAEAARILGGDTPLDKSTVTRMAGTERLPIAARLPGPKGALLFRRADVERLARAYAESRDEAGQVTA